jgi:hypothetical protein
MSKTRAEIQFKVLMIITGGDVGSVPAAEDAANIDGYIDSVVSELEGDAVYIADPDVLDDKLFISFCKLVADAAAEEYGQKSNPQMAQFYRNRIRRLLAETPGYGFQQTCYF